MSTRKTITPDGTIIELKTTPRPARSSHVVVNRPNRPTWISRTRSAESAAQEYWRITKAVRKGGRNNVNP